MKTLLAITLFFISLTIFHSCSNDNIQSGVKGHIEFGEVNCNLDQSFWEYQNYTGTVYAINKDSIQFISGNYQSHSDSTQAFDGDFTIGLEPGHYYIYIAEYQIFGYNTEIIVQLNQVTEKDFRWHKCI
jgi:hypothetical protein